MSSRSAECFLSRLLPAALLLALAWPAAGQPILGPGPIAAPDAPGPFQVGRTSFVAIDPARSDRTLSVDAWYPVDARDATGPFSVYDLIFAGIVSERARADAPVSEAGPFPLVIFSHGSGGIRFQSFFLCEALASHGFVVVAPDHTGNTALDLLFGTSDPFPVAAVNRPGDVSFLIDSMLARSEDPTDAFADSVDPNRIAVAGQSFGGFTALAVASGFASVPPDLRVRAIVPINPGSSVLPDADLAAIDVPTLILGGTADVTTPVEPESSRPFALIPARPRYRVDVIDAGHASFTDICTIRDALLDAGLPAELLDFLLENAEEGCAPELIPIEEAQRIANLYVVAFLQRFAALDPRYARYLTPGLPAAREPDVIYFQVPGLGPPRCGLGFELALLLPPLLWARRRRRHASRESGSCPSSH